MAGNNFLEKTLEKASLFSRVFMALLLFFGISAFYFYPMGLSYSYSPGWFDQVFSFCVAFPVLFLLYFVIGAYQIRKYKNPYVQRRIAFLITYQFVCFFLIPRVFFDWNAGSLFMPWPTHFAAFNSPSKAVVYFHVFFAFFLVPFLVIRYGRGAVCSWFCNYAVRSEIFGDCFRDRAPKSELSVMWERVRFIPFACVLIVTVVLLLGHDPKIGYFYLSGWYAFLFAGVFSSILGQSLFPLLGGRMACRYVCVLGTYVRFFVPFSRFRIKTSKEKCTACGLCVKSCQMGIDVRKHVFINKDISTDRCVGCGICVTQCPSDALQLSFKK